MNLLWDALARTASQHKDKEALVFADQSLTYGELLQKIEACAQGLELDRLAPGSILGIYLPNSIEFVTVFWAIVRSGHIALTLNTKYQEGELQHYLRHRPVARLIASSADQTRLETLFAQEQFKTEVVAISPQSAGGKSFVPVAMAADTTPALMQFSTGSTGLPKGVLRTHGNLLSEMTASQKRTGAHAGDRIAAIVPLYHAHGFANAMCAAFFSGATLVLAGEFEPRATLQLLAEQRITIFPSVPFMVKVLSAMRLPAQLDFSAMRLCFTAGAALATADAGRFKERFGVTVYQLYGSTETGAVALSFEASASEPLDPQSVGRPLDHAKIAIFDEAGELLPTGSVGEIGIATDAAATGYDGNPVATQASFRVGYFFPGDVGRLDESGRLTITGRKSLFINAGGNKIDPAEIEGVLMQHEGVKEVVVLGVPSSLGGEMIKAVIVSEQELSREELLAHCSRHLGAFKLPKIIEFRAEIPKSPLGKVLRKYLM